MSKIIKYKWYLLVVVFMALSFGIYVNEIYRIDQSDEYIDSYNWANEYFDNRIQGLVGTEKYEDFSKYLGRKPREFLGCEDYLFEPQNKGSNDIEISRLMEEKKYEEAILLSDKYVGDSEVWYCDPNFWIQRAKSFYILGNCPHATAEAAHAFTITPSDNGNDESNREFYLTITNSDICKK